MSPYIKKDRRSLPFGYCENCGELNYWITKLVVYYLEQKGECYQTYNDIIGALECAKQELYRRKIIPYENEKIEENGDVY